MRRPSRCLACVFCMMLLMALASIHYGLLSGHLAIASPESGRVWYVSTAGDDLTGNGSLNNPFRTIQKGIDVSADGDTVLVQTGSYLENIDFTSKAILVASYFVFNGIESAIESTVIEGGGSWSVVTFNSNEDSNSVIRGFTLTGGSADYGGGVRCEGSSPTIADNFVVENSAQGCGIYCYYSSPHIYRNLIANNSGPCAIFLRQECYPRIVNNTIANNDWGGLSIQGGSLPLVKNNVFYNNAPYGIHSTSQTFDISYNDVYLHTQNYEGIPDQTGTNGNISGDPLFVNSPAGDYHLTIDSPCIDAGDPADPVPAGGGAAIDMGAFEFMTSERYVRYRSHQIDDSGGNDDGATNPGEVIGLTIVVENTGTDTAYNVSGTLRTEDDYVTVTDSIEQFGDIAPYEQASSMGQYFFQVNPSCPDDHLIMFELEATDGISSWIGHFVEVVVYSRYALYHSHQIDDSGGNNNCAINPGEEIELPITVVNVGNDTAYNVSGTLRLQDDYILVTDSVKQFGDIPPGQEVGSIGGYHLEVSPACPDSHLINFELEATDGILIWISHFGEVVNDTSFGMVGVPEQVFLVPEAEVSLNLVLISLGGFGSQVTLSHSELPSGVTATFDPIQLIPTDTSVFTLFASSEAERGTFPVTITAAGGGISRDEEFELMTFIRGDANGDGIIDVGDPIYLLNYLFKGEDPPIPWEAGDVNCSGQVDLGDAIYLLGYLFKSGSPPPISCG